MFGYGVSGKGLYASDNDVSNGSENYNEKENKKSLFHYVKNKHRRKQVHI